MSSSITNLKKKRKNRTLRSGKKAKANNGISMPEVVAAIDIALEQCGDEIFSFARDCYADGGERGVINVTVKEHPNNPYKRGGFYYLTEADNDRLLGAQKVVTNDDLRIAEAIRTYNPNTEAVIIVWHGMQYRLTVMTDTAATQWNDFAAWSKPSATVH